MLIRWEGIDLAEMGQEGKERQKGRVTRTTESVKPPRLSLGSDQSDIRIDINFETSKPRIKTDSNETSDKKT